MTEQTQEQKIQECEDQIYFYLDTLAINYPDVFIEAFKRSRISQYNRVPALKPIREAEYIGDF